MTANRKKGEMQGKASVWMVVMDFLQPGQAAVAVSPQDLHCT